MERTDDCATYWMVTAVFDESTGVRADTVAAALADARIASRPFFPPLSSLPAFAGDGRTGTRITWPSRTPMSSISWSW